MRWKRGTSYIFSIPSEITETTGSQVCMGLLHRQIKSLGKSTPLTTPDIEQKGSDISGSNFRIQKKFCVSVPNRVIPAVFLTERRARLEKDAKTVSQIQCTSTALKPHYIFILHLRNVSVQRIIRPLSKEKDLTFWISTFLRRYRGIIKIVKKTKFGITCYTSD